MRSKTFAELYILNEKLLQFRMVHHHQSGILFLDELPEFSRRTLEILRQPLEEHRICISRSAAVCVFPADFLLTAAMNPCPCGYYPDRNRCSCSEQEVHKYLGKISGPLLDRFDLCVNNGELVPSARSNCTTLPKQEYRLAGWLYRSATALCQRCEPLFR